MSTPDFATLAGARRCPGRGKLLLALAADLGGAAAAEGEALLDDWARPLFGMATFEPHDQAARLGEVVGRDLGLAVAGTYEPDTVLLDRVLATRQGHPLLLAVIACELAVRAGVDAGVYVSRTRWFVGLTGGERPVVVDARFGPVAEGPPGSVRPLCSHEVAFCTLCGLEQRLNARGRKLEAEEAALRRELLPVHRSQRGKGDHPS